ncbi:MAG: ATP-dependent nuclease [Ardenticatenaceae bacterium]
MLTKLTIRNFKRFDDVEIELGNPVVFIGPNDSGKTTALQAIALWELGLKRLHEKQRDHPHSRVTINRRDLFAVPIPEANLLWRDLRLKKDNSTEIRIEIIIEGVTDAKSWVCGLEYSYANEDFFYCQPLRLSQASEVSCPSDSLKAETPARMPVPSEAVKVRTAFLPPMLGIVKQELIKNPDEIDFLIGRGRTSEVLRNLCYQLAIQNNDSKSWLTVCERIKNLFGIKLDEPCYIPEHGEIKMTYRDKYGIRLDLSSSARGFQQTLLLLAYMAMKPGTVMLLDELDAHLEILRQRQTYQVLTEIAREQSNQIIAASHSQVILNQAAGRDVVIAFVGKPHRINDMGRELLKSLRTIGFEQYYQAEQKGWVLYLEGSTDLAILQAFADTLNHPARAALERPFVYYISSDQPQKARDHFYGLQEAKPNLVGFALYDRMNRRLFDAGQLKQYMWQKREIENYLCQKEVLMAWVNESAEKQAGPLLAQEWQTTMQETIAEIENALNILGKGTPWSADIKASDDFLDPLFRAFYKKLTLPNLMRKTNYHTLARFLPKEQIDPEVRNVLDMIHDISQKAQPASER